MNRNKLSEFREKNELTQEQIAKRLNISKSFYKKVERGVRNPSFNFIKKFKVEFPNVDIDELFFKKVS